MIEKIKTLIESRRQIAKQAFDQYQPLVNEIIASKTKDVNHISYTLDFMLDFCFDDDMLQLYRKLCRYLYDIDPESGVEYVNAYREMWDEDGKMFGNKKDSK